MKNVEEEKQQKEKKTEGTACSWPQLRRTDPWPTALADTYSWSCTVFLSRPTLPGWEELAPGSWALAPGAEKAQRRPHRKGVLSSCRDLMVAGTWEVGNIEDEGANTRAKALSRLGTVYSWETQ